MFWSMVSVHGQRIVSDQSGGLFSLADSLQPMRSEGVVSAGRAVQLRSWGDALATCTMGSRHLRGDPEATSVHGEGPVVRGIWRDAPIACGPWLVADTQESGAADAPWMRVVWAAATAVRTTGKRIRGPSSNLQCVQDMLVDAAPPGRVYRLPSLEPQGDPLCEQSGVTNVGVAGRNVLCVDAAGSLRMRVRAF